MSAGRYAQSAQLSCPGPTGRLVRYLAPRILPQSATVAGAATAQVQPGELHRLDLVANRTLGAPLQSWRIADANNAMDPLPLCGQVGAVLTLPGGTL